MSVRARAGRAAPAMGIVLALLVVTREAWPDTIHFKSGSVIQAEVVKETDAYVWIRMDRAGVAIRYSKKDEVDRIERGDKSGTAAQRLLQTGRLDEAMAMCQDLVKSRASREARETAWFSLSRIYLARGLYGEAAMSYVWVLRAKPGTRFYPYLPLPGGPVEDKARLLSALEATSADGQEDALVRQAAKLLWAAVHISDGAFDTAAPHCAAALRETDHRVAELGTLVQAYSLYRQKRSEQAKSLLHDAIWKHESVMRPVLCYWMGLIAYERKEFKAALASLLRIGMMYEPPPVMKADALWLAGQCFESLGRTEEALAIYDELGNNFGQLAQASRARARALGIRGQPPKQ